MKIHAPHSLNRRQFPFATGFIFAMAFSLFFGFAKTASAAGPSPVAVYRVVTTANLQSFGPDRANRHALRQTYFLIIDLHSLRYRTVNLLPNRKYRADEVTEEFSQIFTSSDAANRNRLILSFAGPGSQWEHFESADYDHCMTETAVGVMRQRRTWDFERRITIQMPTVLRGNGRYESADLEDDEREIETSRTTMTYHTQLTNQVNRNGGTLTWSQRDIVLFLKNRGWTNLFGDDEEDVEIILN